MMLNSVNRLEKAWLNQLLLGVPIAESGFIKTVPALGHFAPLMDTMSAKLMKMLDINRKVHTMHYNAIIISAIDALSADDAAISSGTASPSSAASPSNPGEGGAAPA